MLQGRRSTKAQLCCGLALRCHNANGSKRWETAAEDGCAQKTLCSTLCCVLPEENPHSIEHDTAFITTYQTLLLKDSCPVLHTGTRS